ncbi:hypothetical protein [Streptomyces alfalfae]|uniref:hypothetical protein n=1 Tax=Streptomyces alfalfae TaxID=1642299 RepID=UPI001E2B0A2D|nr:hypothetical protein [Streptomyces alfalfae]
MSHKRRGGDDETLGEVLTRQPDLEVGVAVVADGDLGGDEVDDGLRRGCVPARGDAAEPAEDLQDRGEAGVGGVDPVGP